MIELAVVAAVDVARSVPALAVVPEAIVVVGSAEMEELDLDSVIYERLGSNYRQRPLPSSASLRRLALPSPRRTPRRPHPA